MSDSRNPDQQAPQSEAELPMPSYRQTMKLVASFVFLFTVQVPIAMRQLIKIRKNPRELGHTKMYWYLFVGLNLPITLYFAKNARLEIKDNKRLEQEYLEEMQRTGKSEVSGFEAAMMAMEGDPRKRPMIHTGIRENQQQRQKPVTFSVRKLNEVNGPTVPKGAMVKVHYTGKLADGTVFDSSVDRGQPLQFQVGVGQVISGWDKGICQLKKGQKAIITCPPDYAYGPAGMGGIIPPNATLTFEVEVIDFGRQPLRSSPNRQ